MSRPCAVLIALVLCAPAARAQPTGPPAAPPIGSPMGPPPSAPSPPMPAPPPGDAPSYLPPGASAAPASPALVEREEVHWFVRLAIGLGPRGVGGNNALLDEVGYRGPKMWAELDGAYMFHRHVGAGVWLGMNRRAARPELGTSLNAVAYFVGAELPILLWGRRAYAFHLTPRGGFLSGQVELGNEPDAPFQKTGIFGGALTFNSFRYHIGGGLSYTYAPAGKLGELGRSHDYGGFCVTLHGTIDG